MSVVPVELPLIEQSSPEGMATLTELVRSAKAQVNSADAAFPQNIPPGMRSVWGYYGGPDAFRIWRKSEWGMFPGCKGPLWVGGFDGRGEGRAAVQALRALGVPPGSLTGLDLETRVDRTYVAKFFTEIHNAGYKLWVYGSAGTIFNNPPCNGYFVADYDGDPVINYPGYPVRAKQYAADQAPGYDEDSQLSWTLRQMWGFGAATLAVPQSPPESTSPTPDSAGTQPGA